MEGQPSVATPNMLLQELRRRNILRQQPRIDAVPELEVDAFKLFYRPEIILQKSEGRETRIPQRQRNDRLAAIREVWEAFNINLRNIYTPKESLTVDEQLVGYRGKNIHAIETKEIWCKVLLAV
ncbi:unnamed protein product [Clavelina lepadiformis]|uniref:Transposase n=1 Tax=Clavelina lepadiformis TaxID=159417 RepID=A0ABP0GEC7_CLALP